MTLWTSGGWMHELISLKFWWSDFSALPICWHGGCHARCIATAQSKF